MKTANLLVHYGYGYITVYGYVLNY